MESERFNILVILTSTSEFPEHASPRNNPVQLGINQADSRRTGFNIKEVAYLYDAFSSSSTGKGPHPPPHHQPHQPEGRGGRESNVAIDFHGKTDLTFASPRGGHCHIDPVSMKQNEYDDIVKRFLSDHRAMEYIKNTERLESVNPERYDAVIFPGGSGVLFDLPNNRKVSDIVTSIWEKNEGCVATIGHGLAALINVKTSKNNEYWLKGKRVTCNTVEEEKDLQLDKALPFMLEHKLKEIGARFEKANKFEPKVVTDERLITAQNVNSTREWIEQIKEELCSGEERETKQ